MLICLPVSVGKQTEPGLPVEFCLCLAVFSFLFILKNSLVLPDADDEHTHNMIQSPPCLKIWRVVMYWICPKHNTLYLSALLKIG